MNHDVNSQIELFREKFRIITVSSESHFFGWRISAFIFLVQWCDEETVFEHRMNMYAKAGIVARNSLQFSLNAVWFYTDN